MALHCHKKIRKNINRSVPGTHNTTQRNSTQHNSTQHCSMGLTIQLFCTNGISIWPLDHHCTHLYSKRISYHLSSQKRQQCLDRHRHIDLNILPLDQHCTKARTVVRDRGKRLPADISNPNIDLLQYSNTLHHCWQRGKERAQVMVLSMPLQRMMVQYPLK